MGKEAFEPLQDIDFEIRFIEGIIQKKSDFIEGLTALGDLYTKKGLYQKGLEIDERLSQLRPRDPYVLYNLACSYSLLNRFDKAFSTLRLAVDCGYRDFEYLKQDGDLAALRQDSRYSEFLANLINKEIS